MIMIDRNKLKAAARFAATDPKDQRLTLHGVLVEANPAGVRLAATDGHALLVARARSEARFAWNAWARAAWTAWAKVARK
jgi:hypothetical protein